MKIRNQKVPPTGGPIEVRRQDKMRLASRLVPPPHAAHPPRLLHPAFERDALHAVAPRLCKKTYKLNSPHPAGSRLETCMSSEHLGQLAWQFKRMSGSSGLKVQAAIAC